MPLKIGILGAARIAPMAMIRPAAKVPNVVVHAVAARDEQRAQTFAKRHEIPVVHSSYEALLADPQIDVVYNPLPNGLHGTWSIRAMQMGKDVLCEKPLAANAEEAETMQAVAAESGKRLIEAFHYRYHPLVDRVADIIASGTIGDVKRYSASFIIPIVRSNDIRYRWDLAGGATMDLGGYPIHLIRTLAAAEPEVVHAQAVESPAKIDRTMHAEMRFSDGRSATMECSMWSAKVLAIRASVEGSEGRIDIFNFVVPHFYNRVKVTRGNEQKRERIGGPASYTAQLTALCKTIRNGTPVPTEGDDSVANMRVIDACYRAAGLPVREPSALI